MDADNGNKVLSILWPASATVSQFLAHPHASFQPGGKPGKSILPTCSNKIQEEGGG